MGILVDLLEYKAKKEQEEAERALESLRADLEYAIYLMGGIPDPEPYYPDSESREALVDKVMSYISLARSPLDGYSHWGIESSDL